MSFPDSVGSDLDYYERLNPQDPGDWCPHNVDLNEAGCWKCIEERQRLLRMAAMTDEMLRKVGA
jgi:hypothetical protein